MGPLSDWELRLVSRLGGISGGFMAGHGELAAVVRLVGDTPSD